MIHLAGDATKFASDSSDYRTTTNVSTPTGVTTSATTTVDGTVAFAGEAQVIEVEVTGVSANGNVNLAFNDGTTAITKSVLF